MSVNAAKVRVNEALLYARQARHSLVMTDVPRVRALVAIHELEEALEQAYRELEDSELFSVPVGQYHLGL